RSKAGQIEALHMHTALQKEAGDCLVSAGGGGGQGALSIEVLAIPFEQDLYRSLRSLHLSFGGRSEPPQGRPHWVQGPRAARAGRSCRPSLVEKTVHL